MPRAGIRRPACRANATTGRIRKPTALSMTLAARQRVRTETAAYGTANVNERAGLVPMWREPPGLLSRESSRLFRRRHFNGRGKMSFSATPLSAKLRRVRAKLPSPPARPRTRVSTSKRRSASGTSPRARSEIAHSSTHVMEQNGHDDQAELIRKGPILSEPESDRMRTSANSGDERKRQTPRRPRR